MALIGRAPEALAPHASLATPGHVPVLQARRRCGSTISSSGQTCQLLHQLRTRLSLTRLSPSGQEAVEPLVAGTNCHQDVPGHFPSIAGAWS